MISKEGVFIEGFHCIHVIVPISCEGKRIIKNSANLPNKILLRLHQISWLILAKDYVFFTWIDQYWDLQHSSQSKKANQMKLLFETQPQFSLLSYRECPRWWSFFPYQHSAVYNHARLLQHSSQSKKANQMKLLFKTQPQFSLLSYWECPRWWFFFYQQNIFFIIMPDCLF